MPRKRHLGLPHLNAGRFSRGRRRSKLAARAIEQLEPFAFLSEHWPHRSEPEGAHRPAIGVPLGTRGSCASLGELSTGRDSPCGQGWPCLPRFLLAMCQQVARRCVVAVDLSLTWMASAHSVLFSLTCMRPVASRTSRIAPIPLGE